MNSFFVRIILLSMMIFLFFSSNCFCSEKIIPDEIATDLATLEAAVIKSPEGRYLLNMGTDKNIKKGSLWSVYDDGEQIIDPHTGKSLGVLPVRLAICKVIRVEKYFSEISIQCIKQSCDIQSGLTATRFREIKTIFVDISGTSFQLYELFRSRFTSLDWQGYEIIETASDAVTLPDGLVIVADKKNIIIWSGGEILAIYEEMPSLQPSPQASIVKSELPGTKKKENQAIQNNVPGLSGGTPGLNTNIDIKSISAVASIDHSVASMGIMTPIASELPYFIYLYNKTIVARTMDGIEQFQYIYKGFGEVMNMSLGHNGLIVLNIYVQSEGMRSRVLRFSSAGFTVLSKDIDYFMQFSDISESREKGSLIGQNFDADNSSFDPVAFYLALDTTDDTTNKISRHNTITVPPGFCLPGAFFADLDGNKIPESAFYNAGGKLVIYEDGKQKWESSESFGPSHSILIDDMTNETNAPNDLRLWPQPVLLQSDNLAFAIIPSNNSGFWRIASGNPQDSGLGILFFHSGTYTFRLLNTRFQGSVQSVSLYDNTFYVAVVEGNIFTGKGTTHILAIPVHDLKENLK